MTGNTEARLKKVIQQFNGSAGLHVKHQVDSEKERTILNLIIGTSKALVCFKKIETVGMFRGGVLVAF